MSLGFCSNILYKQAFKTDNDITVSFLIQDPTGEISFGNLLLQTNDKILLQNNNFLGIEFNVSTYDGFGVFLLDSSVITLTGGGAGGGLGIITDTTKTSLSAVSGFFLGAMYDATGIFSLSGGLQQFKTGTSTLQPSSFVVRKLSSFEYVGSQYIPSLTTPFNDSWYVFRVAFKNNMQQVVFYKYEDDIYKQVVTYNTGIDLGKVPDSVRVGITWSGDFPIKVKNITFNGNITGDLLYLTSKPQPLLQSLPPIIIPPTPISLPPAPIIPTPPGTTTTTTAAPGTTTTTTAAPGSVSLDHAFTSSSIPINVTSSGNNFNFSIAAGTNPTLSLNTGVNYDFNINTSSPFAIRVSTNNTTTSIPEIYNNNITTGKINTTLMYTPTATGVLYYVNTNSPLVNFGTINII